MIAVATRRDAKRVDIEIKLSIERVLPTLGKRELELLKEFVESRGGRSICIQEGRADQPTLLVRDGNCILYRPWKRGEPKQWEGAEWGGVDAKLDALISSLLDGMIADAQIVAAERKNREEARRTEVAEESRERQERYRERLAQTDPLFIAKNNRDEIAELRQRIEQLEAKLK